MAERQDDGKFSGGVIATLVFLVSIVAAFALGYKVRDAGNIWRSPFTQQLTREQMRDRLYQNQQP